MFFDLCEQIIPQGLCNKDDLTIMMKSLDTVVWKQPY